MSFDQMIKDAREVAVKTLNEAHQIKDENPDVSKWDGAMHEQFTKGMAAFREKHAKVLDLEQRRKDHDDAADGKDYYAGSGGKPPKSGDRQTLDTKVPILTDKAIHERSPEEAAYRKRYNDALRRFCAGGPGMLTEKQKNEFFMANLVDGMSTEELALTGEVDSLGGFTVPEDFQAELIRDLAGFAVMRPISRVRTTGTDNAHFLILQSGSNPYTSGVLGHWRRQAFVAGGDAPPTQDQPRFGRERVPIHSWVPAVIELPVELIADSAIDLEAEIRGLLAETRALDEDAGFITGDGQNKPEGVLNGGISTVKSGVADGQSYDGLIDLRQALPAQYRSRPNTRFLMNSITYGAILKLRDGAGNLIVPPNTLPDNLWGTSIVVSEFMPDGAGSGTDNNHAIIYGDFSYYAIADRMDLRLTRLIERFAPNIGILAHARIGGQLLKTTPFRMQSVGT